MVRRLKAVVEAGVIPPKVELRIDCPLSEMQLFWSPPPAAPRSPWKGKTRGAPGHAARTPAVAPGHASGEMSPRIQKSSRQTWRPVRRCRVGSFIMELPPGASDQVPPLAAEGSGSTRGARGEGEPSREGSLHSIRSNALVYFRDVCARRLPIPFECNEIYVLSRSI